MEFSRQEYWSGLPFAFPGDLSDPGMESASPALQADNLPSETPGNPDLGVGHKKKKKKRERERERKNTGFYKSIRKDNPVGYDPINLDKPFFKCIS